MIAILPIFCFVLVFLILMRHYKLEWRSAFLSSSVLWGILVLILTEGLSLFDLLSFFPITIVWGIICLSLMAIIFYFHLLNNFDINWQIKIPRFELGLLVYLSILAVVIGVIAWVSPPNTWDSMTYHMSRVAHWIQNKSVAFYPTHIIRQLSLNPWTEYAILHFQILSGNDRFANFIQCFSMVGSVIGVSLLAKELNANIRGQIFAAVVCATIPMGILQASSTQTDYVVAFWLVCFVYFTMLFRKKDNLFHALGIGFALGLAILTKATAYIYAFPFLVWLGFYLIRLRSVKPVLLVSLALTATFIINIAHYTRSYNLFGSPLGPGAEGTVILANEIFSPSAVTSNLIRNIGLHISTPFSQVNSALDSGIYSLHQIIEISPNDLRTTFVGSEFHVGYIYLHEDLTGNLIHLSLILVTLIAYFLGKREKQELVYVISTLAAFVLFSTYLKWQPWNSRLHLPWFVLFSPFIGSILSRTQNRFMANLVITMLMAATLPWLFLNASKPLIGNESTLAASPRITKNFMNPWKNKGIFFTTRTESYFNNNSKMEVPYLEAVEQISELGCSNIGLIIGGDDWEYPIWVFLREKMGENVSITHVNVTNISQQIDTSTSRVTQPNICAVIVVSGGEIPADISIEDVNYSLIWNYDLTMPYMKIFIKQK